MTRLRLIGNLKSLKHLLKYYGEDATVMDVLTTNLTPIQQNKLEMLGPGSWVWKGAT